MKTVYEEVYGHKKENDAMLEASKRAQENLDKLEKQNPGTKKSYNEIWKICGGVLGDKFIAVRAMINDNTWFKNYSKYIEPDYFKDENADILAEIVAHMKDNINKGIDNNIVMIKHYVYNLRPSHFPVPIYVDEYKSTVIRAFNCLDGLPEELEEDAKASVLSLCLQRNTLRRTLSDPDVYIAAGVDVRIQSEVSKLMSNGQRMMDILDNFNEERELVNSIKAYIQNVKGRENEY